MGQMALFSAFMPFEAMSALKSVHMSGCGSRGPHLPFLPFFVYHPTAGCASGMRSRGSRPRIGIASLPLTLRLG
jgi:hypothetical protein